MLGVAFCTGVWGVVPHMMQGNRDGGSLPAPPPVSRPSSIEAGIGAVHRRRGPSNVKNCPLRQCIQVPGVVERL